MLTDGQKMTPSAIVIQSLVEFGITLPDTNMAKGRVFYLTQIDGQNKPSAYVCDGVSWTKMGSGNSEVVKYDVGMFCASKVLESEVILSGYLAPRQIFFAANLPDSIACCKIPPTSTAVYTININDVACGTVTFGIGQTVGTIAFPYSMMAEAGHFIELVSPITPDTSISDVGFTMVGNVLTVAGQMS